MLKISRLLALGLVFTGFSACGFSSSADGGSDANDPPNPAYEALGTGFHLSREMSSEERGLVRSDVVTMSGFQFSEPGPVFEEVFGGDDEASVLEFLKSRMHYFISDGTDVSTKLQETTGLDWEGGTAQSTGVLMARNLGIVLWISYLAEQPKTIRYNFDGSELVPDDPRFGLIQLGPGYSPQFPPLARITTLVHEARHSDCTGGLAKSDLDRIRRNSLPDQKSCGHLHVNCPAGHELAGLPACDNEAWGAYSVDYLFTKTVARSCANCSEEQRQEALALAADSASRILVFDDMVAGRLGNPDMSSLASLVER